MDHTLAVCVLEPPCRLDDTVNRRGHVHRAILGNPRVEILAGDVLHHQEAAGVTHIGVKCHHDVRMAELRDRLDLALEPLHKHLVFGKIAGEDLERHDALHPPMTCLENRAHAPSAEPVEHLVIAHHQLGNLACSHHLELVLGQAAGVDEMLRQHGPVGRPAQGTEGTLSLVDLFAGNEPAFDKGGDQVAGHVVRGRENGSVSHAHPAAPKLPESAPAQAWHMPPESSPSSSWSVEVRGYAGYFGTLIISSWGANARRDWFRFTDS